MKSEYISTEVWKVLYSRMTYENALAIRVSLETGLRIGDVVALPRAALQGSVLRYVAAKTGKEGRASLSADLARRLPQIASREWIFPSRSGKTHRARQTVYKDLKAVARSMGVDENVTPHSARKTYAVGVYRADGLKACQKRLQHDREATTLIYALADKLSAQEAPAQALTSPEAIDRIAQLILERLAEYLKRGDALT